MEISLRHLGEVEVDDDVDCLDVDASGEEVWRKISDSFYFCLAMRLHKNVRSMNVSMT